METQSFFYKLKSRPGQLLTDHLTHTSDFCSKKIQSISFQFDTKADPALLTDVAGIIGFTHDLGKATGYFQNYINEENEQKKRLMKNDEKTHHGLLSSFFTYQAVRDYIDGRNLSEHPVYCILPILSWLIVKKHHGNPENIKDEINGLQNNPGKLVVIKKQLASIEEAEFDRILKPFGNINIRLTHFSKDIENIVFKTICRIENKRRRKSLKENLDHYFLFQLLYSSLLSADKRDAAGIDISGLQSDASIQPS